MTELKVDIDYKPPINKKRKRPKIVSRGKFSSVQELIDRVFELASLGTGILCIAKMCGIEYKTVKRIISLDPDDDRLPVSLPDYVSLYVVVTERGVQSDIAADILSLNPEMGGPWIHGAPVAKSGVRSVKSRIIGMDEQFGKLRVAKLVWVDPKTLMELG